MTKVRFGEIASKETLNKVCELLDMQHREVIGYRGEEKKMDEMTDEQMQFLTYLITTITDKCQTIEEVKQMNRKIRERLSGIWDAS